MAAEVVRIQTRSVAERAAFTALLDLAELLADAPIDVADTRVIGGHMVELHVARHGLREQPAYTRTTLDADFGLDNVTLRRLDLIDRFARLDYMKREGHRFYRELQGQPEVEAIVDVLVPKYKSGPGKTKEIAGILTYQTPGLAELLRLPPLLIELEVSFGADAPRKGLLATADERGALFCKLLAWKDRRQKTDASKDAFDIWRCLELCHHAGVREWPEAFDDEGRRILRVDFGGRDADGCRALVSYLGAGPASTAKVTRTVALAKRLSGHP